MYKMIFMFSLFCMCAVGLCAQIKLDLKTSLVDKAEMKFVKAAARSALLNTSSFAIKEVGEDYSVWILPCTQALTDTGLVVTFNVELRTPAMFGQGKPLQARRISYCMREGVNYACLDTLGISADSKIVTSLCVPLISITTHAVVTVATSGASVVASKSIDNLAGFLGNLVSSLGTPQPAEKYKSILAGIYIATAVREMVVAQQKP